MPSFHGYVDVGALELYCERHGYGHLLVLLHGAFGTIESCFADLLPALARDFEVGADVASGPAGMPQAQLSLLPGTSHEGMFNRVEWLSSMITRFLTSPKQ